MYPEFDFSPEQNLSVSVKAYENTEFLIYLMIITAVIWNCCVLFSCYHMCKWNLPLTRIKVFQISSFLHPGKKVVFQSPDKAKKKSKKEKKKRRKEKRKMKKRRKTSKSSSSEKRKKSTTTQTPPGGMKQEILIARFGCYVTSFCLS